MTPLNNRDTDEPKGASVVVRDPRAVPAVPSEAFAGGQQPFGAQDMVGGGLGLGLGERELDLAEFGRILRRRWGVAASVLLLTLAAVWLLYARVTPVYEAATTVQLDKSLQNIPGVTGFGFSEELSSLATEMEIVRSRGVAARVAAKVGYALRVIEPAMPRGALFDSIDITVAARPGEYVLQRVKGGYTLTGPNGDRADAEYGQPLSLPGVKLWARTAAVVPEPVRMELLSSEAATGAVRGSIGVVQPVANASVLRLTGRDTDPVLAARIADAAAQVFQENQAERRQSGGKTTIEFIRDQLDSLDLQLAEAETKIRDFRSARRIMRPGDEAALAVSRRAEFEGRITQRTLELQNVEALLNGPEGYRDVLRSPLVVASSAGMAINQSLEQLESRRADLLTRRTEQDPDVQLLDRAITDYQRQGRIFVANLRTGLRNEIESYQRALQQASAQMAQIPTTELELANLERNTSVLLTLQGTLRARLKEAEISNAADAPTVGILDPAVVPSIPVAPVLKTYLIVGLSVGLILAVLAALLRDKMDRTIHSREDIEQATGAPLMAMIPSFKLGDVVGSKRLGRGGKGASRNKALSKGATALASPEVAKALEQDPTRFIAVTAPRHVASEAYRVLRTNLRFAPAEYDRKVLAISSPSPGDGKSTTSLNYAGTLAVQGKKVLVIDGDMRRGTMHHKLGVHRVPGLSGVLTGRITPSDAVQRVVLDEGVALDVMTCGEHPPNPAELLGAHALTELVAWARATYDQVVIDTPPVNLFADGLLLAAAGDSMLLIGRAGKSFREELAIASEQLRALNIPLAGVVLNDFDVKRDGRYGGKYYYYDRYYYRYYSHYAREGAEEKTSSV